MRTYTLACSIVVHLLVVALLVVTPIVVNGVLPEPRRAFDFIAVRPVEPPPPAPADNARRSARSAATKPGAAPIEAPDTIGKEAGIDRFESSDLGSEAGIPGGVPGGADTSLLAEPVPPPPPAPELPPVRVGGSIRQPRKIRDVAPVYPAIAQSAGVQGVVILEAVIGEDGRVRNVRVLRPIPLLDRAAIDAVRQWQFTPTLLNGEPVPVVMTVTVAFTLRR